MAFSNPSQDRGGVEPVSRTTFAEAFGTGRAEVQALFRSRAGRRAWGALVLSSPLFCAVAGLISGVVLFAASAKVSAPGFVRLLNGFDIWRRHVPPALAPVCTALRRLDAGPGVFQDHPAEFLVCALVTVTAGFLLAVLLRAGLPPRLGLSVQWEGLWRSAAWGRDAGRLFGLWEHWAGGAGSLRRKTVTGSQLLLLRAGVKTVCDTIRLTVFGWVLVATDYGLHALVMLVVMLLDSFSGLGLDIMIQRDGDDVIQRLPTYWTIQLLRGCALFGLAWVAAPFVAAFYAAELAETRYSAEYFIWLTRVVAVVFLLRGAAGFGRELRQREMDFRAVIQWDILAHVLTLAVGLAVLFWMRNVLALAAFFVACALGRFVVSYALHPWRPRPAWNGAVARQVFIFASSIVGITVLNSVAGRIDHATVGKLLGMAALGFYGRAYALATMPSHNFTNIIAPIMLPALRTVRGELGRFRRAFLKALAVYAIGAVVMAAVFALAAHPLVKYVFGQNGYWLPLLPPLYILLFFGVSRAVGSLTPAALFVLNKPWLVTLCTAVWAAGVCAGVVPLTRHFGLLGTAWTVVLSSFLSNGLAVFFVMRLTRPGPDKPD